MRKGGGDQEDDTKMPVVMDGETVSDTTRIRRHSN